MAKKATSPIRKGTKVLDERMPSGESIFLAIQPDSSVDVVPLESMNEMVSVDQHAIWLDAGNSPIFPCISGTGEQCPGCQLGDKPRFRGFLPILTKEGERIFAFGIQVARSLSDIDDATDGIRGQVLRIKRSGSGLSTRWSIITTGKTKDVEGKEVPDVAEHLGPTSRSEILELLFNAGIDLSKAWTTAEKSALLSTSDSAGPDSSDELEVDELVESMDDDWDDV